jgi:nitrite reductase/ring-hydroxylating ferredoxin subunit
MQLIARADAIPERGLRFTYHDGPFPTQGILIRLDDGRVRAYRNECRHLAIPLDEHDPKEIWDRDGTHLQCSAHGARYRLEDGLCVSGPCAGSHLKSLEVEICDGAVYLNTSKLGSFFDV